MKIFLKFQRGDWNEGPRVTDRMLQWHSIYFYIDNKKNIFILTIRKYFYYSDNRKIFYVDNYEIFLYRQEIMFVQIFMNTKGSPNTNSEVKNRRLISVIIFTSYWTH